MEKPRHIIFQMEPETNHWRNFYKTNKNVKLFQLQNSVSLTATKTGPLRTPNFYSIVQESPRQSVHQKTNTRNPDVSLNFQGKERRRGQRRRVACHQIGGHALAKICCL